MVRLVFLQPKRIFVPNFDPTSASRVDNGPQLRCFAMSPIGCPRHDKVRAFFASMAVRLRPVEGAVVPAKRRTGVFATVLRWMFAAASILCALPNPALAADEHDRTRVFGFLPIVSTERLARRFEPLVEYLAGEIGVPIVLETAPDYAEFIRRTHEEERYDYIFTAPHFSVLAQDRAGYRIVARVDGELLRSVIVVRQDSGLTEPGDLCGKTIATPDPLALVTALVRERLIEAGCSIDGHTTIVPTPSHNASLMSVYRRASDAAGLGTVPLGRADSGVRTELQIVAENRGVPNMPFAVAPWVSDDEAARFAGALIDLKADEDGPALLEHLRWHGFARADPEEYDLFLDYARDAPE